MRGVDVLFLTGVSDPVFQRAIGAYRIASHLRLSGYSAQVIDFVDHFTKEELLSVLNHATTSNTKVLGVSTTFLQQSTAGYGNRFKQRRMSDDIETVIREYKKQNPHIKVIAGGANAFIHQGEQLFDAIVTGYGEEAVLDYLEGLIGKRPKRIWPKINSTEIINGDEFKFDVQHLDHIWDASDCILEGETLPIEISRGCIFRCKFCSYPLNGKKKLDYIRHPELLKKELIDNYEKFGVTNYFFSDDTFNDSTEKVKLLHDIFVTLPFKIKFVAYIRLDLLYAHPEQITMLKDMGLASAGFGIESLKPETAKFVGKGLAADKIKEFLPKLYYELWNEEIPIICSFIVGLPYETLEEVTETFNWIKSTNIPSIWLTLIINPNAFYKSDIDINYEKYGYVLDSKGWTSTITDSEKAFELASRFTRDAFQTNTVNTWLLMSLLSYKTHSFDQLRKMKYTELMHLGLDKVKQEMVKQYKEKLFLQLEYEVNNVENSSVVS